MLSKAPACRALVTARAFSARFLSRTGHDPKMAGVSLRISKEFATSTEPRQNWFSKRKPIFFNILLFCRPCRVRDSPLACREEMGPKPEYSFRPRQSQRLNLLIEMSNQIIRQFQAMCERLKISKLGRPVRVNRQARHEVKLSRLFRRRSQGSDF